MNKIGDKLYLCVQDSEDEEIGDIDLLQALIDCSVSFYSSEVDMIADENFNNKCFVLTLSDYGTIKNNPKYISSIPKTKVTKSKK